MGHSEDRLLHPSIPVGFVEDVLLAARWRGVDVESVLAASGLSARRLKVSGARVSIDQYSRVVTQLRREMGDAFVGFLSQPVPGDAFRVFSYSLVGCEHLSDVVDQANDFYALLSEDFRWQLDKQGDELLLRIHVNRVLPVDYRFILQSLLLMSMRLFGWLLGEDIRALSVNFSFSRDITHENLRYLFGSHLEYEADGDFICIDGGYGRARLSCTRRQVDHMLRSMRHLFFVSRHGRPLSQEIRRRLLLSRDVRWLEIGEVAQQLQLDKHQLWRKLGKEGTSFLSIRDQLKRDWALALLEDADLTVEAVAETLHYADVSAFRKAFRKWTGEQPGRYREALARS
ncbi:MAG: AraC family transcriptional regulator ligand-binding domain-containing protein [Pseudomonadota bacterium]